MAATDAVTATAVARREARESIARMEYHLSRGPKGAKGVRREVSFLDALHRRTITETGRAVGTSVIGRADSKLGQKALAALQSGNSAAIGRAKSSVLADFSADALQAPRQQASALASWKWTANASACPSCLDRHGRTYSGDFTPLHPSCLCIPQPTSTPGLRELSDSELVEMSEQYGNPRYRSQVEQFKRGDISRGDLSGLEAVNTTRQGAQAVAEHLAKGEVQTLGLPGGIADDVAAGRPTRFADPDLDKDTFEYWQVDGQWTAERQALHDDIVRAFLDADDFAGEAGEFYMMGGGPASGKSTMLGSDRVFVPKGRAAIQIDPDEIKKFLPEFSDMTAQGDLRAAAFAHRESSYLSKRILAEGAEQGRSNIVLDGVGDKGVDDVLKKLQAAKDQGYTVHANYATLPTDKAWELSSARAAKTGRMVPEEYLRSAHADVSDTFFDVIKADGFDTANLWDTDIFGVPRHVFEWADGVGTIHDEALLAEFLAKGERGRTIASLRDEIGGIQ